MRKRRKQWLVLSHGTSINIGSQCDWLALMSIANRSQITGRYGKTEPLPWIQRYCWRSEKKRPASLSSGNGNEEDDAADDDDDGDGDGESKRVKLKIWRSWWQWKVASCRCEKFERNPAGWKRFSVSLFIGSLKKRICWSLASTLAVNNGMILFCVVGCMCLEVANKMSVKWEGWVESHVYCVNCNTLLNSNLESCLYSSSGLVSSV